MDADPKLLELGALHQEVTELRAALAARATPAQPTEKPLAWLATDLDGHGDVAFTQEEAKRRAGESCTYFYPLYDTDKPQPSPSSVGAAIPEQPVQHKVIESLLREARTTLEMWKDVAPAVSLCADIDKALAGVSSSNLQPSQVSEGIRKLPLKAADVYLFVDCDTGQYCEARGENGDELWNEESIRALLSEAAALAEQVQGQQKSEEFMRGVIASLGALAPHCKYGDVIHDEIVRSVGKDALYCAAEPEDIKWAGLDPLYYAEIKQKEGK
jgi:hypothetical protein